MEDIEQLRELRLRWGWRLKDVADALGVTEATVSRIERGLQEPSPALLEAWHRLLTGDRRTFTSPRRPRRRPRGVMSTLADLFLADVQAGLSKDEAGWRELREFGLAVEDIEDLGPEIRVDPLERIRINPSLPLEPLLLAQKILNYRETLESEQQSLAIAIEQYLPPIWGALSEEQTRGAILMTGLAEMVRAAAPLLDAHRSLLSDEPSYLFEGAAGPALLMLGTVGIEVSYPCLDILDRAHLTELGKGTGDGSAVSRAKDIALKLGVGKVAELLGEMVITAVGAAWATQLQLESKGIAVVTEVGFRRLSEAFWTGVQLPRSEIEAKWRQLAQLDPETDEEAASLLFWHWPEVL